MVKQIIEMQGLRCCATAPAVQFQTLLFATAIPNIQSTPYFSYCWIYNYKAELTPKGLILPWSLKVSKIQ